MLCMQAEAYKLSVAPVPKAMSKDIDVIDPLPQPAIWSM